MRPAYILDHVHMTIPILRRQYQMGAQQDDYQCMTRAAELAAYWCLDMQQKFQFCAHVPDLNVFKHVLDMLAMGAWIGAIIDPRA